MAKVLSYSYNPFSLINDKLNQIIGEIFRPMVTIKLSCDQSKSIIQFEALVDSGADENLFPAQMGEILGINFNGIKSETLTGIGGIKIKVYVTKIYIWILGERYSTKANFSYEQDEPVLGRKGFFDLFESVCFKEKERFTVISLK